MGIDRGRAHEAQERIERRELWRTVRELRAALEGIAAHDPYPAGVFTPLTEEEEETIGAAIRASGVRHPEDRTYAAWGRHIGRQYAEMTREALARWQHVARDGDCREFEGDG